MLVSYNYLTQLKALTGIPPSADFKERINELVDVEDGELLEVLFLAMQRVLQWLLQLDTHVQPDFREQGIIRASVVPPPTSQPASWEQPLCLNPRK